MSNVQGWMERNRRMGWILLAAGLVVGVAGLALPLVWSQPGFNPRIVTGVGILLAGLGIARLVQVAAAGRDPKAMKEVIVAQRDERMIAIRARAGSRAYGVSAALAYALLMWVSFAGNGSLPALSDDALWLALAGVVVLPFLVYAGSLVVDQQRE